MLLVNPTGLRLAAMDSEQSRLNSNVSIRVWHSEQNNIFHSTACCEPLAMYILQGFECTTVSINSIFLLLARMQVLRMSLHDHFIVFRVRH